MKLGAVVCAGVLALGLSTALAPAAAAAPACAPWSTTTVASGMGLLENLTFDGRGSMLVSETSPLGSGALRTVTPTGAVGTAVPNVDAPGGLVRRDDVVYFTTGNSTLGGVLGNGTGTVSTLDLNTGEVGVVADGLSMPNGLAQLPDGDLLVTRNLGSPMGITRVSLTGDQGVRTEVVRTDLGSANGIAAGNGKVFVGNTFDVQPAVTVLDDSDLSGPSTTIAVDGYGPFTGSDDLTVGQDGAIYLAQNVASRVLRIDPVTGVSCVVASGLPLTSAVEFGGVGFDPKSLYATSFDGSVRKLTPA